MCDPDIVYMPADHPALLGTSALREFLAAFPPVTSFTQPLEMIDGSGDLAVARARFAVSFDIDGQRVDHAGKALTSLRRDSVGSVARNGGVLEFRPVDWRGAARARSPQSKTRPPGLEHHRRLQSASSSGAGNPCCFRPTRALVLRAGLVQLEAAVGGARRSAARSAAISLRAHRPESAGDAPGSAAAPASSRCR